MTPNAVAAVRMINEVTDAVDLARQIVNEIVTQPKIFSPDATNESWKELNGRRRTFYAGC